MSDKLVTRNGETVDIDLVLEALEQSPDKAEVMEALKALRHDKVKGALDQTVKAAHFDLSKAFDDFLKDGEKSSFTISTYTRQWSLFTDWTTRQGLHVLQVVRSDANRFKEYLKGKYSNNSVRLVLATCSSFYTYLEAEQYLTRSPFVSIKYPKKVYKKAVLTSQGAPIPVMSTEEFEIIVAELVKKASTPGTMIYEERSRKAAVKLLPIVHIMAFYGLRIGDVLTLRIESGERFSYRQKGGQVQQRNLLPETLGFIGDLSREPFKEIPAITVQGSLRRFMVRLVEEGKIRHAYSCHDFRHYFAVGLYQETKDIYAVKQALGHASIGITEIYLSGLGVK